LERITKSGRGKEWFDHWLQDDFAKKYAYIDIFHEPFILHSTTMLEHGKLALKALKYCKAKTSVPLAVGFAYSTRPKFIELCESKCDYMTYHFYNDRADYKEDFINLLNHYKRFRKPIVISEFNSAGGATKDNPDLHSEEEQVYWLANILHLIKESNLKGYTVHNLHEPSHLIPYPPWGIYRKGWTPKPCLRFFP